MSVGGQANNVPRMAHGHLYWNSLVSDQQEISQFLALAGSQENLEDSINELGSSDDSIHELRSSDDGIDGLNEPCAAYLVGSNGARLINVRA
jgi:hypothetical protein